MASAPVELISPAEGETVSLWTCEQRRFAQCEAAKKRARRQDVFIDYLNLEPSRIDHSIPDPVVFRWRAPRGKVSRLEIFAGSDPEHPRLLERHTTKKETFAVYNLPVGARYFWRVSSGGAASETRSFSVADETPRWIYVPGATNVRDFGGRTTVDGRRVRQDMLFRGSEFDRHQIIRPSGKRMLYGRFKLKTDLDVRGGTEIPPGYRPPLDPARVDWVNIPIRPYDLIFTDDERAKYARIVGLLADEKRYPVYFHCWGCADRGGTLAFLLGALLGIPEGELLADYEYTTCSIFAERRVGFRQFDSMLEKLDELAPDVNRAAEIYVKTGGATDEEIAAFRRIMLEA
ncbi:MAG: tyrosine-protein phosphatase [Victivallaceae bacterium]|nr:tyrosine-protein phosphatase [Victivallaceae bacterium]